jgi:hypothetical protein
LKYLVRQRYYFLSTIDYCTKFNCLGLVNGTRAIIKQIVFAPGADYKTDLPWFIMLEVDGYTGSSHTHIIGGHF